MASVRVPIIMFGGFFQADGESDESSQVPATVSQVNTKMGHDHLTSSL